MYWARCGSLWVSHLLTKRRVRPSHVSRGKHHDPESVVTLSLRRLNPATQLVLSKLQGTILTAVNALSTCHPEQNPALAGQSVYKDKEIQDKQIVRLIGESWRLHSEYRNTTCHSLLCQHSRSACALADRVWFSGVEWAALLQTP